MSTIVKNEEDLNTLLDEDLITEHFSFELLGLKNIADFRKFSRSFMKADKKLYELESNFSKIDEIFKNFCPYSVGEILLTTNSTNPATKYLGTTWQKIEGRFLLGTSGSGVSKQTGGSNQKTIAQANLPNVKLTVNSFSLSRGTMDITGNLTTSSTADNLIGDKVTATGAFELVGNNTRDGISSSSGLWNPSGLNFKASKAWTGSTNSVSPQTSALGNGNALDITPSYYTCHMWLRTS